MRGAPKQRGGRPYGRALFGSWGVRGGGPDHGGGPLLSLQHSRLPNDFNPVNHPFRLSEMTENGLGVNPSRGAVRPGSNRGGWRSAPNSLFRGYPVSS